MPADLVKGFHSLCLVLTSQTAQSLRFLSWNYWKYENKVLKNNKHLVIFHVCFDFLFTWFMCYCYTFFSGLALIDSLPTPQPPDSWDSTIKMNSFDVSLVIWESMSEFNDLSWELVLKEETGKKHECAKPGLKGSHTRSSSWKSSHTCHWDLYSRMFLAALFIMDSNWK